MITLKIAITVLFFEMAFTQTPVPPEGSPCPDDQNNCPSNSYCYIYSETGRPYCAQSCELNNGGCGTEQCVMVTVQCFTAPCPPIVECRPATDVCELPPVVGDCDAAIRRFFFNSTSQRCEIFIYGGCGGNANNFVEESECARTCQSGTVTATASSSTISVTPTPTATTPGPYTCSLQPESGLCLAAFQNYFYNVTSRSCQMFIYGGCGGNDNRFSTAEECSRTCERSTNICGLEPETGLCEAYFPSYFYNVTSKNCERFIYGGCGGNDNRFSTLDQCQDTCGIDVCTLQPEAGNCRGSFPRYFYNKFTRKCEQFIYGGCGGNGNRFSDVRNCEETCISTLPAISPTPVVSEKNIISITVSSNDGDLDGLVADFTGDLMEVLRNNGVTDVSIRIVDIASTPDDDVILTVAVYSGNNAINGDRIAVLINENKETFSLAINDAVVLEDDGTSGASSVSRGAVAGIVIGLIAGLIQT